MKRDERSLKWAKVNGYKYVMCDDDGNINGYGFSRQTLENNNEKNLNIMTIRQYEKATKEVDMENELERIREQLPEGELKCISIDCPGKEVMPIPQEDIPKAFASFFNIDNKEG